MRDTAAQMIEAARELGAAVERIKFSSPVTHVYNPLFYAWRAHQAYLRKFANSRKRVVFLGMNPGPFGMVQTGVPFGEISAVRDWMQIEETIDQPPREHRKRPVDGFGCRRSEVSGKRLWGLFAGRFGFAENFFADHFVANYCPLAFFDSDGRNLTPDKLAAPEAAPLFAACDRHLHRAVEVLEPEWLIGIGDFAAKRARLLLESGAGQSVRTRGSRRAPGQRVKIGRILHPSPASPAANKDWAGKAAVELRALGIWSG